MSLPILSQWKGEATTNTEIPNYVEGMRGGGGKGLQSLHDIWRKKSTSHATDVAKSSILYTEPFLSLFLFLNNFSMPRDIEFSM